jgi:hypothetical protein
MKGDFIKKKLKLHVTPPKYLLFDNGIKNKKLIKEG